MLKRLHVNNYKCLVDFELELEELTLLMGVNGAGKSSVLDVVVAVRKLLSDGIRVNDPDAFPPGSLTRWQTGREQVVSLRVALKEDTYEYRLEVEHDKPENSMKPERARILLERLSVDDRPLFEFESGTVRLYNDKHEPGPVFTQDWSESQLARVVPGSSNTRLTKFLDFMRKVIVCSLIPPIFSAEAIREDAMLSRDGANFANWCRSIFQGQAHLVGPFTEALRDVIDGFRTIRLDPLGVGSRVLTTSFEEHAAHFNILFSELSDGQRALIALYGLLHLTEGQGYTLFLDEPDNYVALAEIQPWLIGLSEACGDTLAQAVVCSHHPELIDYLGGECGVLLNRGESGAIMAKRLDPALLSDGLPLSEIVASGWEK